MKKLLTLLFLGTALCGQAQVLPYQNSNLSADERADDLLRRLTLEEKASLMMDQSPAIPRLGIPAFHWWNEALHGVGRNGTATVFPITMQMAASWDDALLYRVFTAVSDEARAKHQEAKRQGSFKRYQGLSFWTPNINIFRDPRWGRGQETYGEDPYLTSVLGLAVVNGLQGQSLTGKTGQHKYRKLLACAKHFAVHSGPEWNRHSFDVQQLPPRDLWETYLPVFKALVQDGRVGEVMCAYQRLDGHPCCGSNRLLQQILRNEWGFQGIVTSDCWAVNDFFKEGCHGVSKDAAEATARAIVNGTDVECGDAFKSLPEAVRRGELSEERVDASLKRLLKARFELGDFDADSLVEWTQIPMSVVASKEHRQMALQMAREGTVLLKNNGLLPLSVETQSPHTVAVMGPNANDSTMMWGNYNGFPRHTVTILEGLRQVFGNVPYVQGCGLVHQEQPIAEVLEQVKDAETIIFVGGISPKYEGEEMKHSEIGFHKGDRTDIELPAVQRQLLKALYAAGKKVVLVNCSGSAVALVPEQEETCDAILQAWYGGEKGGKAIAEILTGQFNPCGKLPVTFYRSTSDLPDFLDYTMKNRTYRYFRGEALYPFGYGLSYTTFNIDNVKIKSSNHKAQSSKFKAQSYTVSARVKNTGKMEGTEVIQVYIRNTADKEGPLKSLRAFQRVTLKPGESRTVTIDLPRERFEGWDVQSNTMRVVPGRYEVLVGTSSADRDLHKLAVKVD